MKRQFLGDGPDSFKWDYHDWLASELKYPRLTVALMLTPDDAPGHGQTSPEAFPARTPIVRFCHELRSHRDIARLIDLPKLTGGGYDLALHKGVERPLDRASYFSGFARDVDQVVFIDPDNGFEPEKSCSERHVRYDDVKLVLSQLNENSFVSVFQFHRRTRFDQDLAKIRARLGDRHSTAVFWRSLMFVAVATSERVIEAVAAANAKYGRMKPVECLR